MAGDLSYQALGKDKQFLIFAYLVVALWYLIWRTGTFNPAHPVFSVILYGAEIFGFATILLHLFTCYRLTERRAPPPQTDMRVAVLVPSLNEPVSMVRQTLLGVMHMDYPHETWLLDDGNREEMANLATDLDCGYLTRAGNTDAKAGALNNALASVSADFIAVFDADHVPTKDFLNKTLGYFRNEKVAFVQTPQDFYNLDSYQHRWTPRSNAIWTEQSLFFRVIQRGKDYWNATFFCGSCAIIRRTVLDDIGGFATGTVTEDVHTSIRIHKKGHQSVYHAEPLAYGLAPGTIGAYLSQRLRWGQGYMQIWRKEGILFGKGLTFPQRISYLASGLAYVEGWQRAVLYFAPAIVLSTGWTPIMANAGQFFLHFIPYYALSLLSFEEIARGYGRSIINEQFNMTRFWAYIVSTLGWFRDRIPFVVTRKAGGDTRKHHRHIVPQYIILGANAIAIPVGIALYALNQTVPAGVLLVNIFWAGMNAFFAAAVILATLFHRDLRHDYRFPIPLPVKIDDSFGVPEFATAENISSSGFRIYARSVQELAGGGQFRGKLFLPDGELPFTAEVVPEPEERQKDRGRAVGCRFLWAETRDHDRLDLFLYGSDLQWHVLALKEQVTTPLDGIKDLLRGGRVARTRGIQHWAPVLYHAVDAQDRRQMVGLISTNPQGPRLLMAFQPLGTQAVLQLLTLGKYNQNLSRAQAALTHRVDNFVAPVYIYRMGPEKEAWSARITDPQTA